MYRVKGIKNEYKNEVRIMRDLMLEEIKEMKLDGDRQA